MNHPCPDEAALFAAVDEPESAASILAHAKECTRCATTLAEHRSLVSDLRLPSRDPAVEPLVEAIMVRVRADAAKIRKERSRWVAAGAVVGALAIAAALVVWVESRTRAPSDAGEFASRGGVQGGADPRSSDDVVLSFDLLERDADGKLVARALSNDATRSTTTEAHLLLSYGSRLPRPTYLLSFAVDSAGEVHWLYPAFPDPTGDPASMELAATQGMRPMSSEVVLSDYPAGTFRVFAILGAMPLHVSDIESLPPDALTRNGLSSRFAGVDVRSWPMTVTSGARE